MKKCVQELFEQRVSLRRYEKKPISQEHMDQILHGAMRAPTAGNMMLYSIIKVEDAERKKQLSESCDHQPFIATAPTLLIFCVDFQRWYDYYALSDVPAACAERGVPFRTPEEGDFMIAMMDAMIASSYANIAAEACGIGSCYIGDIIEHYEFHKELLNLPQWVVPVGMLCLGYYPENARRIPQSRFDRKFIVSDEQYHRLSDTELEEMFANRAAAFNPKNRLEAANFGQFNYFRKTGTEFSDEMTRSVRVILESWKKPVNFK